MPSRKTKSNKKIAAVRSYVRAWPLLTVALVVLTMLLGWRVAHIINPPHVGDAVVRPAAVPGHHYLVYRSYRVVSRGDSVDPGDDIVAYEFFRYPLDGSASRGESVVRIVQDGRTNQYGWPQMEPISDDTLLFVRYDGLDDNAMWVDASGNEFRSAFDWGGPGLKYGGLPSPDHGRVAYYDGARRQVVVGADAGPLRTLSAPEPVRPLAWQGNQVYWATIHETENRPLGLYRLDLDAGTLAEIETVRAAGLSQFDFNPASGRLVGIVQARPSSEADVRPDNLSAIMLLDLNSGGSVELTSGEYPLWFSSAPLDVFSDPKISPDGAMVAYTVSDENGQSVWVSELDLGGHERRLVSGTLLDWSPDSRTLIVDRDGELQLVSTVDGSSVSVARRSGSYSDPDFHGVDYVGVVSKR
ncbi:MAG: hypothetical protein ABIJ46_04625 [bacterium]